MKKEDFKDIFNPLPKNYFLPQGKFTAKYNSELNNGSTKKC